MKIIYKKYNDWAFEKYDLPDGAKMIGGNRFGKQRLSSVHAFKETDQNIELAIKHNRILEEINKLETELMAIVNQMEQRVK